MTQQAPLPLRLDDLDVAEFAGVAAAFGQQQFGFVVTPNVDHVVRLREDARFHASYQAARFILLDSRILALLLKLHHGLAVRVSPGSDVAMHLMAHVARPDDRIVLVGGTPEQATRLAARYGLRELRHIDPPMGFIHDPAAVEACLAAIEACSPFRFCLLAVGSPQQELVAQALAARGRALGLAFCIGAAVNFLTGTETRAPVWLQRLRAEWLFRLLQNPRRMAYRYLVRGPRILTLMGAFHFTTRRELAGPAP